MMANQNWDEMEWSEQNRPPWIIVRTDWIEDPPRRKEFWQRVTTGALSKTEQEKRIKHFDILQSDALALVSFNVFVVLK